MAGPRRMSFKAAPGPSVLDHLPDLPRDHRRALADFERHPDHQTYRPIYDLQEFQEGKLCGGWRERKVFGGVQKATAPANDHRMANSVPVIWAGVGIGRLRPGKRRCDPARRPAAVQEPAQPARQARAGLRGRSGRFLIRDLMFPAKDHSQYHRVKTEKS